MDKLNEYREGKILLIDKPLEWTSFNVVDKVRRQIKCKVGHGGTLDPLATGLLVIATGKKTKTLNQIQGQNKTYEGVITLGKSTPSYDLETDFDTISKYDHVNDKMIFEATKAFTGIIYQMPPKFSALKVNGQRAYKKARKNENFKLEKREVEIFSFEITNINLPDINFKVSCSKGTYIRSLAHDFGIYLNTASHLSSLRRTAVGDFKIEDSESIDSFIQSLNINNDNNPRNR